MEGAMRDPLTVLVVDDEESVREGCRQALEEGGYEAKVAVDGLQGLQLLKELRPKVVLVDLRMPRMDGMELLDKIREIDPNVVSIVISGYGTMESAVEAMKKGASDFLRKPFNSESLLGAVTSNLGGQAGVTRPGLESASEFIGGRVNLEIPRRGPVDVRETPAPMIRGTTKPIPVVQMKPFLSPKETAEGVVSIGARKCQAPLLNLVLLGILAGVYIGFGAELCTMVIHDLSTYVGIGLAKFVGGSVFSVGLMLVVLAGAELFTGNCLIFAGLLAGECSARGMIRNWTLVYLANFIGSILLAALIFGSGLWKTGDLGVGAAALKVASAKVNLSFLEAFLRGVGCNWLVCLAVWLAVAGRDIVSKIFGVYFPIMAFVASGFEHSIANMYFIPMGLFLKQNPAVVNAAGLTGAIDHLTWLGFLVGNLIPVTLGNVVGGALFVGGVYYLVYLRNKDRNSLRPVWTGKEVGGD